MSRSGLACLLPIALVWFGAGNCARAQEALGDLAQARAAFQRELDFATRPIRERYIVRLETLKRSLGARGEARAALAVQEEIDRVRAAGAPTVEGVAKFAGVWLIEYKLGGPNYSRRYAIKNDGALTWEEENGKPMLPPRKGRIAARGSDYVAEFDGSATERFTLSGDKLTVEQFNSKASLASGVPENLGTGSKVGR